MNLNMENCTKPFESFGIHISKCYSFSENMVYFLAPLDNSITSYYQKLFTQLQMITLYFAYLRILASNFHCNLKKYMKSLEIFGNKISKCPIIILKNTPLPALSSKELKLYLFHRLYYPVQQSSFKFHKDLIFR